MAIKRIQIKPPTNGYADVAYPETSIDMVKGLQVYTAGGTANALTINTGGTFKLVDGAKLMFKATASSTGAVTVSIDGGTVMGILTVSATQLPSGKLIPNRYYEIIYDQARNTTNFFLLARGSGTALATDILAGKTATTDAGEIIGTMYNGTNGASEINTFVTYGAGILSVIPEEGYYDNSSELLVRDANYMPTNIKNNVNMFGLVGSYVENTLSAGNNIAIRQPDVLAQSGSAGASYIKVKEAVILRAGVVRVKFDMRASGNYASVAGRIYKNGVPVGIERIIPSNSVSATDVTYTEDIAVTVNDKIQIYAKMISTYDAVVNKFQILTNETPIGYMTYER